MSPRVLPADVYDTLEFSALAFGGIGKDSYYVFAADRATILGPCCAAGHLAFARGDDADYWAHMLLQEHDCGPDENDGAIRDSEDRISFPEWCRRLNVVRGVA